MVSGAAQDGAMYIYCRLDISKHLLDSIGLFYYITINIRDLVTLLLSKFCKKLPKIRFGQLLTMPKFGLPLNIRITNPF